MKNILITGGAGFIGLHLAENLSQNGYRITIRDNLSTKFHSKEWPEYLDSKSTLIQGDITNRDDLKNSLYGIDIIFHLAAEMDLNPSYQRFIDTNVGSTL